MSPSDAIAALLQLPGWTETRIAQEVGTTQPTINRIKRGGQPAWATGEAIVELATANLPKPAPRKPTPEHRKAG